MLTWFLAVGNALAGDYARQCFHRAQGQHPIGGIAQEQALEIAARHTERLRQLPGAASVSFLAEGLVVATSNPAAVPAAVEGLPVFAVPTVDPRASRGLAYALSHPPGSPPPEEDRVAYPPACQTTMSRGIPHDSCCVQASFPPGAYVPPLPPPPGVIVLQPSHFYAREQPCPPTFVRWWEAGHYVCYPQAETCPASFKEWKNYGWRFCFGPTPPTEIPMIMVPPIAGIPYYEVLAIYERQRGALGRLPGVCVVSGRSRIWLQSDGIHIQTRNPSVVPEKIEGVPTHYGSPIIKKT